MHALERRAGQFEGQRLGLADSFSIEFSHLIRVNAILGWRLIFQLFMSQRLDRIKAGSPGSWIDASQNTDKASKYERTDSQPGGND